MSVSGGWLSGFEVLGGLALLLFGMNVMTQGLRGAAGGSLRTILHAATSRRAAGLGIGTLLGFLAHSSAGSVMLVGFVNAGLMTLRQSLAPMVGANLGTTLSMQVISFRLDDYAFAAIAAGFLVSLAAPGGERGRQAGRALMGFGLLFLGMRVMSGAIRPHREWLAPLLENVDGTTAGGMLLGLAASALFTAVIQSSGATIGMVFALGSAGVFTRLEQVYPIVLGAHIGTCATALLGSMGTQADARRAALWHLLFNGINVTIGLAAAPWLLRWIPRGSGDLLRQTAHTHTVVMALGAAAVLPFIPWLERMLRILYGRGLPAAEPSCLDRRLLRRPENALRSGMLELRRVLQRLLQSLRLNGELFFTFRHNAFREVRRNEELVNEIKTALLDFLSRLNRRYLSRRQIMLMQHISRCMSEIERIGDHIARIADLCRQRLRRGAVAYVDSSSFDDLFEAYRQACRMVLHMRACLDPDLPDRIGQAHAVLTARDAYFEHSRRTQAAFAGQVAQHRIHPEAAFYYGELLNAVDRIVRHARIIALAALHADFWIKPEKLGRPAAAAPALEPYEPVLPERYLRRLADTLNEPVAPNGEPPGRPGCD